MSVKSQKREQKHFFIKSYQQLPQLEEALKISQTKCSGRLEVSVLGKLDECCISNDVGNMKTKNEWKVYCRDTLGASSHFGLFCNPEIGTLFIAGVLVSQFLNDLDGKALGELTSGPYCILRGLGINKKEVIEHIKKLDARWYVLLVRGRRFDLDMLELTLKEPN